MLLLATEALLEKALEGEGSRDSRVEEYIEVRYADLWRPVIALFEQRRALKAIREAGQHSVSETQIFRTVEDQRRVIVEARRATLSSRRRSRSRNVPSVEIRDRFAESGSTPQPLDQGNETQSTTTARSKRVTSSNGEVRHEQSNALTFAAFVKKADSTRRLRTN